MATAFDPSHHERLKAFPISWVTTGRTLLLVGGCDGRLCRLGHAVRFDWARIRVHWPDGAAPLCPACLADERVELIDRALTESDIQGASLVVESTSDEEQARQLAGWCRDNRVPLNAMDKLAYCDLYYNSMLFLGPLVLAIGSGGESPAAASALRRHLEEQVGPGWGHAAALLAQLRRVLPASTQRMELLLGLAKDPVFLRQVAEDDVEGMQQFIQEAHDRF